MSIKRFEPTYGKVVYQYTAFGLNIECSFELPGLGVGFENALPIVSVRHARSADWAELAKRHDYGDFLFLQSGEFFRFWFDHGQFMTFAVRDDCEPEVARFFLESVATGSGMALLLRQRGLLVLHASVVLVDGEAILFVGESGWGKSTLAEYFGQQGYTVLSDDVAAIDTAANPISIFPGNSTIKLRTESQGALLNGREGLRSRHLDGRVHVHRNSTDGITAFPIRKMYLLEESFHCETSIEDLTDSQRVIELVRHTHGAHLLTRPDYQARLLHQAGQAAKQIPFSILRRSEGLDKLPMILDAVKKDCAKVADSATIPAFSE